VNATTAGTRKINWPGGREDNRRNSRRNSRNSMFMADTVLFEHNCDDSVPE